MRAFLAMIVAVGGTGACAELSTEEEEDVFAEEEQAATVAWVDFESYPTGQLGSPWSVSGLTSSVVIENTGTARGDVLLMRGRNDAYVIASLPIHTSATDVTAQSLVNPAPGATFIWSLHGAGTSIGRRRIRLIREPGSTTLVAQTVPSGRVVCGSFPSGVWSTLTLRVHATQWPHTFDVLINGRTTACTAISCGLSAPFNAFSVMDAGNEGFAGNVRFDDLLIASNR